MEEGAKSERKGGRKEVGGRRKEDNGKEWKTAENRDTSRKRDKAIVSNRKEKQKEAKEV